MWGHHLSFGSGASFLPGTVIFCPSWVLGSGAFFLLGAGEGSSIGWLLMAVYSCVSPSMMFALDGGS